jgi:glycosyltransferase involved in cell wall biosynthesis
VSSLSVILITLNEEHNIRACLQSVRWADEIIVVDAESKDSTAAIAREFTDKVFVIPWQGYAANKSFAVAQAHNEWVFWIDADEVVPEALADEIMAVIRADAGYDGYEVARKAYFLGRWIKHCGWYPGYVLRLFRRSKGRFNENRVHEGVTLDGPRGRLRNSLDHYTDRDLEHYMWKFNRYTSLAAEELVAKGHHSGVGAFLFRPLHAFIKMYILKRGFLDGVEGLMLCLLSANYVAAKYAKVWELSHCNKSKNSVP